MVKRISCRVVDSAALAKNSSEPPHANKLNNKRYDKDRTGNSPWDNQIHISILEPSTYIGRTNVPLESFEDAPIGLILDCYA